MNIIYLFVVIELYIYHHPGYHHPEVVTMIFANIPYVSEVCLNTPYSIYSRIAIYVHKLGYVHMLGYVYMFICK